MATNQATETPPQTAKRGPGRPPKDSTAPSTPEEVKANHRRLVSETANDLCGRLVDNPSRSMVNRLLRAYRAEAVTAEEIESVLTAVRAAHEDAVATIRKALTAPQAKAEVPGRVTL